MLPAEAKFQKVWLRMATDPKSFLYSVRNEVFDDVLELQPDPASLPINEYEAEEKKRHDSRLDYLPTAMELLRSENPEGYALIKDYFYSEKKVSLMFLASKYGITFEAVRYRLNQAKTMLKEYFILHETE